MALAERDQIVEALAAYRADQALAERVCARRPDRRFQRPDAHRLDRIVDVPREDGVAIVDEPAIAVVTGDGLSELLESPLRCGMLRDVEMQQTPAAELHDDEHVQDLEAGGHDREEVAGNNGLSMVADKGGPALIGLSVSGRRVELENFADGLVADIDAQLEVDLVGDASDAPGEVEAGNGTDEATDVLGEGRPT